MPINLRGSLANTDRGRNQTLMTDGFYHVGMGTHMETVYMESSVRKTGSRRLP